MIAELNKLSLKVGIAGIILQVAGVILELNQQLGKLGLLVQLLGTILLIAGLAYYAKAKGRHPAWCLFGFLSIVGIVVLACLKDQTGEIHGA